MLRHHARARRILCGALGVLAAIELDDELRITAAKVGNLAADRHLAPELRTQESAVAKPAPELRFRVGHRAPQLASAQCDMPGLTHVSRMPDGRM